MAQETLMCVSISFLIYRIQLKNATKLDVESLATSTKVSLSTSTVVVWQLRRTNRRLVRGWHLRVEFLTMIRRVCSDDERLGDPNTNALFPFHRTS